MPKLLVEIEEFFNAEVKKVEAALDAGWTELKPAVMALGQTILSQAETAAAAYIGSGFSGKFIDVLRSVTDTLPADAKALEVAVAGYITAKVAAAKATTP